MENARVVLVEDDADHRFLAKEFLLRAGHEVTHFAVSLEEAHQLADELRSGEADVLVSDGDLGGGRSDGIKVVALFAAKHPGMVLFGNSASGEVAGATYNVHKNYRSLVGIINGLKISG